MNRTTRIARLLLPGACVLALAAPVAAQLGAPTGPEVSEPEVPEVPVEASEDRETLTLLLSGYHGLPEAAVFEARFDDPRALLLALLQDPSVGPIHYDRALAALAYWPNPEVRAVYDRHLVDATRPMMVHHIIVNYVRGFGDEALDAVLPYLSSEDVQVRLTVVEALRVHGTPRAVEALIAAEQGESHALVRERIREATALR